MESRPDLGYVPPGSIMTVRIRRSHPHGGRARGRSAVRLLFLATLVALATAGRADEPPAEQWIRPEGVPARADALLRRLEDTGPDATAEAAVAKIERALPLLALDLAAVITRADDALGRGGAPTELEDLRREVEGMALPPSTWKAA